ncbi:sulfotransferase domain-containing protein [Pelagibius litoralis]|uniref:Sulfotransferase domain-containing protein n=1 Tax=Pelagibius litoralis TaxID=374515 RepID=A0A967CAT0_9PROT|nr:sulfotransferase [Pelagibius litoralis]NIA67649.1 sulfotransferase domain-containing protein [Pelagibius litoralis]
MAPDFIIIGAMKCGTTSLHRYLDRHPQIGMSRSKETDFFLAKQNFARGLDWYRAQFGNDAEIYGETSPNYTKATEFPGVAERIFRTLPDAKLIYIVRDPVNRFLSQYFHHTITGEAVIKPNQLLHSDAGRNYLECSRYHRQLSRYLEFYPLEGIFVACFDELRSAPESLLRRLFLFLGVDSDVVIEGLGQIHNQRSELQELPPWYFHARRSPVLRSITRRLSPALQSTLRRQLRHWPQRRLPMVDEGIRAELKSLLQEDTMKFRELTGMPFNGWSL